MRRLSIVCVTFNSAGVVADALRSARASAEAAGWIPELVVVDNASADGSLDTVIAVEPAAIVLRNDRNLGFGAANNQAFTVASGDYWLLINPDATVELDAVGRLTEFLARHPDAAAVGPAVASAEGYGAESSGMAPSMASMVGHFLFVNRLLPGDAGGAWRGFQLRHRPQLGARSVDWLGAMVLLLRPEAVRQVGGFDPAFFMYAEDVDLGERLRSAGWSLWLEPSARAGHLIAASQGGVTARWVDALHDLYARRSGRLRTVALDATLFSGVAIRALVASLPSRATPLYRRRMRASTRRAAELLWRSLRPVGRRAAR